jgi:hypothetical protein
MNAEGVNKAPEQCAGMTDHQAALLSWQAASCQNPVHAAACQNGPNKLSGECLAETNNLNISKTLPPPQITLHIMSHQTQTDLPTSAVASLQ